MNYQIVKNRIKGFVPNGLAEFYRKQKTGQAVNYCPLCEKESVFVALAAAAGTRPNAGCTNCGSLERHRLVWLFIDRRLKIKKNKSMLHVAAEPAIEPKLRKLIGKKYLTADLLVKADIKMDITNIKYPDNSFDYIMCNHVLEHVSDDIKAMREMHRVLKPNGWGIFLVPLADMSNTYEDKKITTEQGRLKAFGQIDHVRKYGRDYIDRLRSVGWNVEIYRARDIASSNEIKRMALVEDAKLWGFTSTEIFYCTKRKENNG